MVAVGDSVMEAKGNIQKIVKLKFVQYRCNKYVKISYHGKRSSK